MYIGMGAPPPHHHHHHGGFHGGGGGGWYGGNWGGDGYSEVVEVPVAVETQPTSISEWLSANAPLAMAGAFLVALFVFRGRN
jgi:hypothetical protein